MTSRAIALFLLAGAVSVATAQTTAVTRLENRAGTLTVTDSAAAGMLLPDDTPARTVELGALTPAETAKAAKALTDSSRTRKPGAALRIGIPRTVPASAASIRLADLSWQRVTGGGSAARVVLTSDGALALRLGIRIADAPSGLMLRFKGSDESGETFSPVSASALPTAHPYWSPVLSGERAVVEFALPAAVVPGDATLKLPMISHLYSNPKSEKAAPDPFDKIGTAGLCEVDVACVASPSPALLNAQNSAARLVFTSQGSTFLCSGTLINDSVNSHRAYVFTANHCIDNLNASDEVLAASVQAAEAASSTNSYWLFHAAACGSLATPAYVLLTGGAKLLARSVDYDWALLQLNDAAPSGTSFSAWRAESLADGASVSVLHHPAGDLTKYSIGSVTGYVTYDDGSSYVNAHWTQGAMEPGSGGGGLFTLSPDGSAYELRGALLVADSSCRRPAIPDPFSRLDSAFPLLAQYLTPNSPPASGAAPLVEFYNAALNDYFVTIDPAEIRDLDNGVHVGWVRTGLRFLAYPNAAVAPAGSSPVCRFYVLPAVGDSHFYSADPNECAAVQFKFPGQWVLESSAVFYAVLPNKQTGVCPANTHAVYRFLNNANGLHHRYTTEIDVRDDIIRLMTWTQEGYGNPPAQVALCSPNK